LTTFKELGLIAPLQRALADTGYEHPTEIQSRAIPQALQGFDVLGCAQTGTGKTAAFVLPILDYVGDQLGKASPGKPFALILAPTRELAIQIGKSIDTYGRHMKLRASVVYGGVNQFSQVRAMQRGSEILVATPGRLLDLMQQGHIDLQRLEVFVLDEADRMLDMGFLPDLKRIIQCLPDERQSLFFSATLAPEVTELAKTLLYEPVVVNVTPKTRSVEKIKQQMVLVTPGEKHGRLTEVLSSDEMRLALVFTRTKRSANQLERKLKQQGVEAAAIHGNKSQATRQRTLEAFRRGHVKVLVATDVAARGIDVNNVSHVVNYDLPTDPESYMHRIGRTGRAGAEGIAITFYTSDQRSDLRAIERFAGLASHEPEEGGSGKPGRQRGPRQAAGPQQRSRKPNRKRRKPTNAHSQAKASSSKPAQRPRRVAVASH
jgi:ATP-dependent RNA helicase RhlE